MALGRGCGRVLGSFLAPRAIEIGLDGDLGYVAPPGRV